MWLTNVPVPVVDLPADVNNSPINSILTANCPDTYTTWENTATMTYQVFLAYNLAADAWGWSQLQPSDSSASTAQGNNFQGLCTDLSDAASKAHSDALKSEGKSFLANLLTGAIFSGFGGDAAAGTGDGIGSGAGKATGGISADLTVTDVPDTVVEQGVPLDPGLSVDVNVPSEFSSLEVPPENEVVYQGADNLPSVGDQSGVPEADGSDETNPSSNQNSGTSNNADSSSGQSDLQDYWDNFDFNGDDSDS